jgi:hypothetical protein
MFLVLLSFGDGVFTWVQECICQSSNLGLREICRVLDCILYEWHRLVI